MFYVKLNTLNMLILLLASSHSRTHLGIGAQHHNQEAARNVIYATWSQAAFHFLSASAID